MKAGKNKGRKTKMKDEQIKKEKGMDKLNIINKGRREGRENRESKRNKGEREDWRKNEKNKE